MITKTGIKKCAWQTMPCTFLFSFLITIPTGRHKIWHIDNQLVVTLKTEKQMNNSEVVNQVSFEERATNTELKEIGNFEDCNEQQATDLIYAAIAFAEIIYNIWAKEQNGKIIEMDITPQINIAA